MNSLNETVTILFWGALGLLLVMQSVWAAPEIGGALKTDNRWRPGGNDDGYTWNETQLELKLDMRSTDAVFHSESRIRYFSFSEVQSLAHLGDSDLIQPWRFEMYEAYADVYGLLLDNLDMRIGKQRIAWGTADKLNVVDNLNPDDFEDILDFGRKIPTMSLRLDYYPGDYTVTGVFIPVFTPARMLSSSWQVPVPFPLPPELTLRTLSDEIILPRNRPQDAATIGLRIKKTLLDYDCSLSYMFGRDDWALPTEAEIIPIDTLGTTDVHLTLEYQKQQIIGMDLAGTVGDVGIWAEGALFLPDDKIFTTVISPVGNQQQLALDDEPYFKYVVGGDYTFKNGIYVNAQYMHGFFTDRGVDGLEDYFLIAVEKKYFHEEIKVRVAAAIEITDFDDIENRSALFGGPELIYYPTDNAEIILGGLLLDGNSSTQFGQFSNNDEVYFKVKYSF